jgi:hypothetical protein
MCLRAQVCAAASQHGTDERAEPSTPLLPRFVTAYAHRFCAVAAHSRPFVVARNEHVAPKQRRIERVSPGYAVREFQNDARGSYWYVVTALQVSAGRRGRTRFKKG